jgi:hypothetical protein
VVVLVEQEVLWWWVLEALSWSRKQKKAKAPIQQRARHVDSILVAEPFF